MRTVLWRYTTCLANNFAGRRVAAKELHSRAICFFTKSHELAILNQTPKKRKELCIEIGGMVISVGVHVT